MKFGDEIKGEQDFFDFHILEGLRLVFQEDDEELSKLVFGINCYLPSDILPIKQLFESSKDKYLFLSDILSISYQLQNETFVSLLIQSKVLEKS